MTFSLSGTTITQTANTTQNITAIADAGSNQLTVSVTAHGYSVGDLVNISGTTNYDGLFLIDSVTTDTFTIPDTDILGNEHTFGATVTGSVVVADVFSSTVSGATETTTLRQNLFDLDVNAFVINGLVMIREDDFIEFASGTIDAYMTVVSSGTLVVFGNIDKNVSTENIAVPQIVSDRVSVNHWNPAYGININGEIIFIGGFIDIASVINFGANSTFRARGGCFQLHTSGNGSKNLFRFGIANNATVDIKDFILFGGSNAFERTDVTIENLSDYSPRQCKEGMMKQSTKADPVILTDFNPEDCEIDTSYIANGCFYIIRGMPTKEVTATVHFDHPSASGGGITEVRKNAKFTITDSDGNAVEGAKIGTIDTAHSTTRDYSDDFYISLVSNSQILTQHIYSETTDSNGQATIDKLLAYVGVLQGENVGRNSASREVLYKTKASDYNYVDDFYICSYKHQLTTISNVDLTGLGEAEVGWVIFDDAIITETDKAVVDAYGITVNFNETTRTLTFTSDNNILRTMSVYQAYDLAKSYLVDNYNRETIPLITRVGETLDGTENDVNVVFDYIKFTGSVELNSNRLLTLNNNSEVSGGILDSAGDSYIKAEGVDQYRVYEVAPDDQNVYSQAPLADYTVDDEGVIQNYRFNFTGEVTYYLAMRSGTAWINDQVTATEAGELVASLDTTSLLASVPTAEDNALEVRTKLAVELDRIDENISDIKNANITQVGGSDITDIEDFKATKAEDITSFSSIDPNYGTTLDPDFDRVDLVQPTSADDITNYDVDGNEIADDISQLINGVNNDNSYVEIDANTLDIEIYYSVPKTIRGVAIRVKKDSNQLDHISARIWRTLEGETSEDDTRRYDHRAYEDESIQTNEDGWYYLNFGEKMENVEVLEINCGGINNQAFSLHAIQPAIKGSANLSELFQEHEETRDELVVINNNVKKASNVIPATEDLT